MKGRREEKKGKEGRDVKGKRGEEESKGSTALSLPPPSSRPPPSPSPCLITGTALGENQRKQHKHGGKGAELIDRAN